MNKILLKGGCVVKVSDADSAFICFLNRSLLFSRIGFIELRDNVGVIEILPGALGVPRI